MEADAETLASVLAFLDAYESDGGCNSVSSCDVSDPPAAPTVRRGTKRAKRAAGYTTALQRQKRAELAALREQATELESHLQQLRRVRRPQVERVSTQLPGHEERPVNQLTAVMDTKRWREVAIAERRLRSRAEVVNRKLREMLTHEMQLRAAILRVVEKHSRSPEAEELLEQLAIDRSTLSSPVDSVRHMVRFGEPRISAAEVQATIAELVGATDQVLGPLPVADVISCSMEKKVDAVIGPFVEIRTTTTTGHRSLSHTTEFYWRERKGAPKEVWNYFDEVAPDTTAFVRKSVMTLPRRVDQRDDPVYLNVQHYAHKFETPERAVIVMLAHIYLPALGVSLREHFWTRLTSGPRQQVVVETCYRIFQVSAPATPEAACTSAFVTTGLTHITRSNMLTAQNWLLDPIVSTSSACCVLTG